MELTRWRKNDYLDPMGDFGRLQEEINKLFDWSYPENRGLFDRALSPAVDLIEDENDITLVCDLPGISKDELDLSISQNVITIKGEKKAVQKKEGSKTFRNETWSGAFQRTVSLPESVDPDKVEASMKNGVLTVKVAKREEVKPRQISVQVK